MSYEIIESSTSRIVAGQFKVETFFYVGDADKNLVGRKSHATREEAQLELDGMGHYLTGLEFAKAQFPKDGDKAHVAKANIVARYLAWEAAGRPVLTADEATEEPAGEPAAEPADGETF